MSLSPQNVHVGSLYWRNYLLIGHVEKIVTVQCVTQRQMESMNYGHLNV